MSKSTDKTEMSQAQIPSKPNLDSRASGRIVYLLPALYAAALFTASTFPVLPAPDLGFDWQDKLYHASAYGLLGVLMAHAVHRRGGLTARRFWISVAVGLLYGVTDELHQRLVPGRFCDFFDGLADAVGVLSGHAFYRWARLKRDAKAVFFG